MGETRIVLARPQDARNVGSVCRAMMTMGLQSLYLVAADGIDMAEAAHAAVHATDLLDNAARFDTVAEAVSDCALVAGATRRLGRRRKGAALLPDQLAQRIAALGGANSAVVFGNESHGLSDDELAACHVAVTIPTHPEFPSLNLSHAVQLLAYELRRGSWPPGLYQPVPAGQVADLADTVVGTLVAIGYFRNASPEAARELFRDVFGRAALSRREAARLREMFTRVSGIVAGEPPALLPTQDAAGG